MMIGDKYLELTGLNFNSFDLVVGVSMWDEPLQNRADKQLSNTGLTIFKVWRCKELVTLLKLMKSVQRRNIEK